jgi:hypothetical protein
LRRDTRNNVVKRTFDDSDALDLGRTVH